MSALLSYSCTVVGNRELRPTGGCPKSKFLSEKKMRAHLGTATKAGIRPMVQEREPSLARSRVEALRHAGRTHGLRDYSGSGAGVSPAKRGVSPALLRPPGWTPLWQARRPPHYLNSYGRFRTKTGLWSNRGRLGGGVSANRWPGSMQGSQPFGFFPNPATTPFIHSTLFRVFSSVPLHSIETTPSQPLRCR